MATVPHSHAGDERASYYLDQLFMIGVCAAVAGVTVVLWQSAILIDLLHPKFNLFVGAGGIALLAVVLFRAASVWLQVDEQDAHKHGPGCDHGHADDCGHTHGHDAPKPEHVQPASPSGTSLALTPAHSHAE